LPAAGARLAGVADARARPVYRQQSLPGSDLLDARYQSDAGHPDGAVHAVALLPALRFHVSVPWHAALGAVGGRTLSGYACPAYCARWPVEGQHGGADSARTLADRSLHPGGRRDRDLVLSRDT